jgi:hypothetical protein
MKMTGLKGEKEIYEPLGQLTIAYSNLEQKIRFVLSKLLHIDLETAEYNYSKGIIPDKLEVYI